MDSHARLISPSLMRKILPPALADNLQADTHKFYVDLPTTTVGSSLILSWPRILSFRAPGLPIDPFLFTYDVHGKLNQDLGITGDVIFSTLRGNFTELPDGHAEFQLLGGGCPKHRLLFAEAVPELMLLGEDFVERLRAVWQGTCPPTQQSLYDRRLWVVPCASLCLAYRRTERQRQLNVQYDIELNWRLYRLYSGKYQWQMRSIDPALRSIGLQLTYYDQSASFTLQPRQIPPNAPGWNRAQAIINVLERSDVSPHQEYTIWYDQPHLQALKILATDGTRIEVFCSVLRQLIGLE